MIDVAPLRLRRVHLADLSPDERRAILEREATATPALRERVRAIIQTVREGGDTALREANVAFGGGLTASPPEAAQIQLGPAQLQAARDALPSDLRRALEHMAANIERFHAVQVPAPREQWVDVAPGIRVGRTWRGLRRVAAYVPGGAAAYPSSLLMSAIPARLAGVDEFVVASAAGRDGSLSPALLGAAGLMEVDAFYVMGGAQAIAALAYGTQTVAAVDKIVGPGNAWVTAAKVEVFGRVAIDMPAGPSEVMVVADGTADPVQVAADLLSQAEHGPDSPALLVTPSAKLADAVQSEVERQLPSLARAGELRASIGSAGTIVLTRDVAEALAFADSYAPEHLSLVLEGGLAEAQMLPRSGSLFLGPFAPESAGDYATGSNHILPTGGLARSYGALSVEDFGRWQQVQHVTREGLASIRDTVATVAEAEGLTAHRRAVDVRFEPTEKSTDE